MAIQSSRVKESQSQLIRRRVEEKDFHERAPLEEIWVRVYGFPMFMNDLVEYEKIFNPWGAYVLEVDAGTHSECDVRFVRLRLEVCSQHLIPQTHLVPYRNLAGKKGLYHLEIEIEGDKSESLHAWARRKNGRPYPSGTEFGQTPGSGSASEPTGNANQPTGERGFFFSSNTLLLKSANNRETGPSALVESSPAKPNTLTNPTLTVPNIDTTEDTTTPIGPMISVLTIPAISGFPEIPILVVISLPPCDCCGYQFHEESFFDFQEDEMSYPNIDFDSEDDETILDKPRRMQ